jgi:uncharacterized protein YbjT (DUF2867 family)
MTRILVTGGTGRIGRPVVARLRDLGCDPQVLSHTREGEIDGVEYIRADLAVGEPAGGTAGGTAWAAVREAVGGAEVIIHCAGANNPRADQAITANLLRAVRETVREHGREPHLVKISVVGADRVPVGRGLSKVMFGYFESMRETERAIEGSGLPWTILRATQFFDAVALVARVLARLPVIPVAAGVRFQPVDTGEVASRLVELALAVPSGLAPDFGGPVAYPMAELVAGYLHAVGKRRPLVPVRLPGTIGRVVRDGANLPDQGATLGHRRWEEFLRELQA